MANGTTLWISGHLAERIRAHGVETYPHECCGALLGRDSDGTHSNATREVLALFPLVNRHRESPRNRFTVTAEDGLDADRAAQPPGRGVIGGYRSRPGYAARTSPV